jgi:hypothetical protein
MAIGPKDAVLILSSYVEAREPVLLVGAPGIGKSDVVKQVAAKLDYDLIITHPQVSDPTDYKGYPFPSEDKKTATFLPFGDLAKMLAATRPTIVFLDDIGQSPVAVQAALMQLILAREINGKKISEHVTFVAATNRKQDMAGVTGLLETVKSRFSTIIEMEPNVQDYCEWALLNNVNPIGIGYVRFRPAMLFAPNPTRDLVNSPNPRTDTAVFRNLDRLQAMPEGCRYECIKGAAGEAFAADFIGWLKVYNQLPNIDLILMSPEQAEVPQDAQTLYAVCSALSARCNERTIGHVIKYTDRIPQETHLGVEMCVFVIKDAITRDMKLSRTKEFAQWCVTYGNTVL